MTTAQSGRHQRHNVNGSTHFRHLTRIVTSIEMPPIRLRLKREVRESISAEVIRAHLTKVKACEYKLLSEELFFLVNVSSWHYLRMAYVGQLKLLPTFQYGKMEIANIARKYFRVYQISTRSTKWDIFTIAWNDKWRPVGYLLLCLFEWFNFVAVVCVCVSNRSMIK